jgi:hypothetical protein
MFLLLYDQSLAAVAVDDFRVPEDENHLALGNGGLLFNALNSGSPGMLAEVMMGIIERLTVLCGWVLSSS